MLDVGRWDAVGEIRDGGFKVIVEDDDWIQFIDGNVRCIAEAVRDGRSRGCKSSCDRNLRDNDPMRPRYEGVTLPHSIDTKLSFQIWPRHDPLLANSRRTLRACR